MKTTLWTLSMAAVLVLAGCGSESDGTIDETAVVPTDITVERGPVLMAAVMDANGQKGENLGAGQYRFYDPEYPVTSYGGYVDVNRNGVVDAGDVRMNGLQLQTGAGNVMTMATTMAQNGELYTYMKELGLTDDEVLAYTPSDDMDTAALSDEVYKFCLENNVTDPAQLQVSQIEQIRNQIQERRNRYNESNSSAAELEESMLTEEMDSDALTAEEAAEAIQSQNNQQQIIDTIPVVELSEEQKYTLAYMWNEERLAHDIYLALNALYPYNVLYNIATRSESTHAEMVEALIEKYDLNILNTEDYSGGYDADALDAYAEGSYSLDAVTQLYDTLYVKGSQSLQDALEVGCMVEVTDVNDLNEDIVTAEGADDLVLVFQSLRSASYNHYWSFDNALKNIGVPEGCCSLGEEYCKTAEEYPQSNRGNH